MSDSDFSDAQDAPPPPDWAIAQCLRKIVRDASKAGEDISVTGARAAAEQELDLDTGYLKNAAWKDKSKDIITKAFNDPASPVKAKKEAPAAKAGTKRKSDDAAPSSKRRKKSPSPVVDFDLDSESEGFPEPEATSVKKSTRNGKQQGGKKSKQAVVSESETEAGDSEEDEETPKKPAPKRSAKALASKKAVVSESDGEESDFGEEAPKKAASKPTKKPAKANARSSKPVAAIDSDVDDEDDAADDPKSTTKEADGSELSEPAKSASPEVPQANTVQTIEDDSDMSVLIDEPPKKKRGKKSTSPSAATKPKPKATKSNAASKDLSPDEEEVKRLQSWLVKCGIRKLWHKELAKCNTSKEKIKHLKMMLEDAGMTGRFSAEKARGIKEARELKAELEEAQSFEKQYGDRKRGGRGKEVEGSGGEGAEDDEEEQRPKRRLVPKGLVDFGDSGDDGSE